MGNKYFFLLNKNQLLFYLPIFVCFRLKIGQGSDPNTDIKISDTLKKFLSSKLRENEVFQIPEIKVMGTNVSQLKALSQNTPKSSIII